LAFVIRADGGALRQPGGRGARVRFPFGIPR